MKEDTSSEWLEKLKVGDEIAISHINFLSHGKEFYTIDKIKSITPGTPYNFITTETFPCDFELCVSVCDKWDSQIHILIPVTQEVLDDIERNKLLNYLKRVDEFNLSLYQLRQIKAVIEGQNDGVK